MVTSDARVVLHPSRFMVSWFGDEQPVMPKMVGDAYETYTVFPTKFGIPLDVTCTGKLVPDPGGMVTWTTVSLMTTTCAVETLCVPMLTVKGM